MKYVLFVCGHNAGRSQMAEAILNYIAVEQGIDIRAESAGTSPSGHINPVAVEAMKEIGLSLEGHYPKQLSSEMVERADQIITMGCGVDVDACPASFLVTDDWGLDDPAGKPLEEVRRIREEIRRRVVQLLEEMLA